MFDDDEIQRKELEAKSRLEERRETDDFLWLMGDLRGRRIVWRLLSQARIFHSTFDTHGGRMSLNEGERQSGLRLMAKINLLCPDLYPVMVRENTVKQEEKIDD